MNKKILLIIAVLASAALSARAVELVQNPGFETGDFTNWTQFGDTSFSGVSTSSPDGTFPHSGNFLAYFGPTSAMGGIQQNIGGTIAGNLYNISFWLANSEPGTNNAALVTFGSTTLLSLTNSPAFSFTQFTYTNVAASSNNALLQFGFLNPPLYWDLDDISVTAAVPEPGTLGLIALGALGLVGAFRKRLV
jgi:PEP-CTERM motif